MRMVKGRWDGRRFSFRPGPDLWVGVDRLSAELQTLCVDVPELSLLLDKGNLIVSDEDEDDDGGGGDGGKRGVFSSQAAAAGGPAMKAAAGAKAPKRAKVC